MYKMLLTLNCSEILILLERQRERERRLLYFSVWERFKYENDKTILSHICRVCHYYLFHFLRLRPSFSRSLSVFTLGVCHKYRLPILGRQCTCSSNMILFMCECSIRTSISILFLIRMKMNKCRKRHKCGM